MILSRNGFFIADTPLKKWAYSLPSSTRLPTLKTQPRFEEADGYYYPFGRDMPVRFDLRTDAEEFCERIVRGEMTVGELLPIRGEFVYLSGKMTGIADFGKSAFSEEEDYCRRIGADVVYNPTKNIEVGVTSATYTANLLADMAIISHASVLFLLDRWEHSLGATAEHAFAKACGKKIFSRKDFY